MNHGDTKHTKLHKGFVLLCAFVADGSIALLIVQVCDATEVT